MDHRDTHSGLASTAMQMYPLDRNFSEWYHDLQEMVNCKIQIILLLFVNADDCQYRL